MPYERVLKRLDDQCRSVLRQAEATRAVEIFQLAGLLFVLFLILIITGSECICRCDRSGMADRWNWLCYVHRDFDAKNHRVLLVRKGRSGPLPAKPS